MKRQINFYFLFIFLMFWGTGSINQDVEYQTLPMLAVEGKDSFQVIVPAEQINSKWDFMYLIEVMDNKSNGKIYPELERETPYIIVKLIR